MHCCCTIVVMGRCQNRTAKILHECHLTRGDSLARSDTSIPRHFSRVCHFTTEHHFSTINNFKLLNLIMINIISNKKVKKDYFLNLSPLTVLINLNQI